MLRKNSIIANIDWILVLLYLFMVIAGWVNIFAVNYNIDTYSGLLDLSKRYGIQLIWILITFIIILMILFIEGRFYTYFTYPIYGLSILLLLLVLVVGKEVNYAKSWISIGRFSIQPSEFAKIGTALALAKYLSAFHFKMTRFKDLMIIAAIIGLPILLILLQPDAGTTLIFVSFILVLYREGLPGWVLILLSVAVLIFILYFLVSLQVILMILLSLGLIAYTVINRKIKHTLIAIVILAFVFSLIIIINGITELNLKNYYLMLISSLISFLVFLIFATKIKISNIGMLVLFEIGLIAFTHSVDFGFNHVLKPHQQRRVNILMGIESDPKGYGYNVEQSKIAIGSGGFSGKGFLQGTQTKFNFVPEQSTDFIFCTVGEEWGFIGTSMVVLAFLVLLMRILIIAERQRLHFARIYGYGVAGVLFFHFFINIGMTIGLFPVIGIPLPFFSYGGSSLISFSILLFILIRFDSLRMSYLR